MATSPHVSIITITRSRYWELLRHLNSFLATLMMNFYLRLVLKNLAITLPTISGSGYLQPMAGEAQQYRLGSATTENCRILKRLSSAFKLNQLLLIGWANSLEKSQKRKRTIWLGLSRIILWVINTITHNQAVNLAVLRFAPNEILS